MGVVLCVVAYGAWRFQSYLYGIEIAGRPLLLHRPRVSIVPLWNWNLCWRVGQYLVLVVSIVPLWNWNVAHLGIQHISCVFQSYLYGIEITVPKITPMARASFNRTFMELKLLCSCSDRGDGVFQSYLYGIEINIRRTAHRRSPEFQSYLYGIEMREHWHPL